MGSEPGKGGPVKAPMINTLLAYVSKPLRPLMEKINVTRESHRGAFAGDVMLPEGYEIEVVSIDLNAPVHATFGPDGACYVTESGYKIDSPPRVVRIDVVTGATDTFFELPADRWRQHGAMTGGCWLDDTFYFANNDTISRVGPGGVIEDVVIQTRCEMRSWSKRLPRRRVPERPLSGVRHLGTVRRRRPTGRRAGPR